MGIEYDIKTYHCCRKRVMNCIKTFPKSKLAQKGHYFVLLFTKNKARRASQGRGVFERINKRSQKSVRYALKKNEFVPLTPDKRSEPHLHVL